MWSAATELAHRIAVLFDKTIEQVFIFEEDKNEL